MSHEVDNYYTFYVETRSKARKAHVCDACSLVIPHGHTYYRIGWKFDGQVDGVKRCVRCQTIHVHLRDISKLVGSWPAERLDCGHTYEECWGVPPPPEIRALGFVTPDEAQQLPLAKKAGIQ